MHQFIETLKTMQAAVSRTADEQQRVKKSRALNALLSMFESIVEDRPSNGIATATDPSAELSIRQLEQRTRHLEGENAQLLILCQEKDSQLHQIGGELQCSRRDLRHSADRNERLQRDLANSKERRCHGFQRA